MAMAAAATAKMVKRSMRPPIFFDPLLGIEILHFGRQLRAKTGRVEMGHPGDAVFSGLQILPEVEADADRRYRAQAGYDDSAI